MPRNNDNIAVGTKAAVLVGTDQLDNVEMDTATPPKPLPDQFMRQADYDGTLGKFASSVHKRTIDKVADTIWVYDNMEDPGALSFMAYYGTDNRPGVTGALVDGALGLDEVNVGDNAELIVADAFPSGDRQTYEYATEDDATTREVDESEESTFAGMFNGVAGKYSCTGTCTATTDEDGDLSELGGVWSFTPTADDLTKVMIPGVDHDTSFLAFGYWLQATEKDDGSTSYLVGTFFDGSQAYTGTRANLDGSATYSGSAAGMYGRKTLNSDGSVASATSGHFTATANLTATFDQTATESIAPNMLNTITGTINNFSDGGQMVDPAWSLKLDSIDIEAVNNDAMFAGSTSGTGQDGNWRGQFFGNPPPDTGVADDTNDYPMGVAGDFTGHFRNGHVIGAFGATR